MIIWNLNIDDIDMTSFHLPVQEEKNTFLDWIDKSLDEPMPLRDVWKSFILLQEEQKIDPDFLDVYDSGAIIVSEKVAEILKEYLQEDKFELLPFRTDDKEYFLLNIFKYTDCLILEESTCNFFINGTISNYEELYFDASKLRGELIFKIKELPYQTFVTSTFYELYQKEKLNSLSFEEEEILFFD